MQQKPSDLIAEKIVEARDFKLPDYASVISESKGFRKFIKKTTFKLTLWIFEPIISFLKSSTESNLDFFTRLLNCTRELERENARLQEMAIRAQDDYNQWIVQNEPRLIELKWQRGQSFEFEPTISFILNITALDADAFDKFIYSLRAQTYNKWELLLINMDSPSAAKIKECCSADERIKCYDNHVGDSDANIIELALSQTKGDYLGFVGQNDILAPFALFEVVKSINESSDVEFLYGDNDKIENGVRFEPTFRPDFAPDTLRSTNYIGENFYISRKLLDQIRVEMEYIEHFRYELVLRSSELVDNMLHIPKILYHRHNLSGQEETKKVAADNNADLIKAHIARKYGISSNVTSVNLDGIYRVDYELTGSPKVSILIPNRNKIELLKPCIESILKLTTYENFEIVIVENNSTKDETFNYYDELQKSDKIRVLHYSGDKEFNYQKIMNFGVKNCTSDYILQLNNDIILITPTWLELMLGFAQREDVGAVSAKLYYPDMSVQHAGGVFVEGRNVCDHIYRHMPKYAGGYMHRDLLIQNVSWATGACLLSRRDIYEQIGFMNEDYEVAFGDVDFCMEIRKAGKLIVYNPYVELFHYEAKTRGFDLTEEMIMKFYDEEEIFINKWKSELERGDPYNRPMMERVVF